MLHLHYDWSDEQRQKIEEALKSENDRLRGELRQERETRHLMEEKEAERVSLQIKQ